jgi:hypothetical protein
MDEITYRRTIFRLPQPRVFVPPLGGLSLVPPRCFALVGPSAPGGLQRAAEEAGKTRVVVVVVVVVVMMVAMNGVRVRNNPSVARATAHRTAPPPRRAFSHTTTLSVPHHIRIPTIECATLRRHDAMVHALVRASILPRCEHEAALPTGVLRTTVEPVGRPVTREEVSNAPRRRRRSHAWSSRAGAVARPRSQARHDVERVRRDEHGGVLRCGVVCCAVRGAVRGARCVCVRRIAGSSTTTTNDAEVLRCVSRIFRQRRSVRMALRFGVRVSVHASARARAVATGARSSRRCARGASPWHGKKLTCVWRCTACVCVCVCARFSC